jgi:hypothetical protein
MPARQYFLLKIHNFSEILLLIRGEEKQTHHFQHGYHNLYLIFL